MYKPIKVKAFKKYTIWVKYEDGTEGEIDLSHLAGKGVFKIWETNSNFEKVYIDKESGAIAWNDQLDICADNVYYKLKKLDPEDALLKHSRYNAVNK